MKDNEYDNQVIVLLNPIKKKKNFDEEKKFLLHTSSEQTIIAVGEILNIAEIHLSSGTVIDSFSIASRKISIPPGFSTYSQPKYLHDKFFFCSSIGVGNETKFKKK